MVMLRIGFLEIIFDFARVLEELVHWNILILIWLLKQAALAIRKRKADPLDILCLEACKRKKK